MAAPCDRIPLTTFKAMTKNIQKNCFIPNNTWFVRTTVTSVMLVRNPIQYEMGTPRNLATQNGHGYHCTGLRYGRYATQKIPYNRWNYRNKAPWQTLGKWVTTRKTHSSEALFIANLCRKVKTCFGERKVEIYSYCG